VKIERQGFAVVDDADRDVGLSVGQICQLAGRQDFHLDVRMQTREIGEVRHEQVCREGRRQRHPQKPAHALVATEDARLQLVRRRFHLVRELEDLLARSRQAVARRQLFEHVRPEAFLELGDASQHGRVVHTEALGGSPHRASARDGKKVANVIPVDHGAIRHRAVRLPKPVHHIEQRMHRAVIIACDEPNGAPIVAAPSVAGSISHHRCARFRTQRLTPADPSRGSRGRPRTTNDGSLEGKVMGKLEGKVAVITGGSSGMALASAKRFVEEGAYVFITGRRQEALDEAVKLIGRNVTGVRGDAANLDDLDRLFDTVKREKGKIDVLYASAGTGEAVPLGEITEQHFDATFGLNTRGTLFTVQKALPLFNDGGSIFMTGSVASVKGFPGYGVYAASKAALRSFARTWLNELKGRNIRVNVLSPGPIATPMQDQVLTEEAKRMFESLIPRGKMGRPEEIAAVALFLASDDSSFVNGVELSVDGGFSAI
jgi:NAD(P)-dependent dehydrogenase (short-subunit alcohol dehydrogenase family)